MSVSGSVGEDRVTIEATLEVAGERLRLSMQLNDGVRIEERSMTVGDDAEAERELAAFAARFPGASVERVGAGWASGREPGGGRPPRGP